MKILGLDIGEKRIGIAISDKDEKISAPFGIINNDCNFKTNIEKIINEYHIKKIVVGMPYTLKGDIGTQARKVIQFVKENINFENVDIDYFDERFTSSIPEYDIKKNKMKKKDIDKLSAAIILQDYLDKNNVIKNDQ
ncbi:MAG: Holliday junction resolvase RuvX [Candidatus Humimicrobiaceae bacterium]